MAGSSPAGKFTGDDFERAHDLLKHTDATLAKYRTPETHPELHDVSVITAGGISGLTATYMLRDRRVLLLEAAAKTGGVSKGEA